MAALTTAEQFALLTARVAVARAALEGAETDLAAFVFLPENNALHLLDTPAAMPLGVPQIDRGEDGRGLYELAIDVIRQDDGASPGTLARALGTDVDQAAALLDRLERAGIVGPAAHCGYREVRAA